MNEKVRNNCDVFIENFKTAKKTYKLDGSLAACASALSLIGSPDPVEADRFSEAKKIIKTTILVNPSILPIFGTCQLLSRDRLPTCRARYAMKIRISMLFRENSIAILQDLIRCVRSMSTMRAMATQSKRSWSKRGEIPASTALSPT